MCTCLLVSVLANLYLYLLFVFAPTLHIGICTYILVFVPAYMYFICLFVFLPACMYLNLPICICTCLFAFVHARYGLN